MKDWNELSMKERAAFIKVGVSNGLKSIDDIQKSYREYADGGYKEQLINWAINNEGALWQDTSEAAKARQWLRDNSPEDLDSLYWVMSDENRAKVDRRFLSNTIKKGLVESAVSKGINGAGEAIYKPVKMVADFTPIVGDTIQGLEAAIDFNNKDYIKAGLGTAGLLMPNIIEKPIKYLGRALKVAANTPKYFKITNSIKKAGNEWDAGINKIRQATIDYNLARENEVFFENPWNRNIYERRINAPGTVQAIDASSGLPKFDTNGKPLMINNSGTNVKIASWLDNAKGILKGEDFLGVAGGGVLDDITLYPMNFKSSDYKVEMPATLAHEFQHRAQTAFDFDYLGNPITRPKLNDFTATSKTSVKDMPEFGVPSVKNPAYKEMSILEGKDRDAWIQSANEIDAEMAYLRHKLKDNNSFNNMSEQNKNYIVDFISDKFMLSKSDVYTMLKSMSDNHYAQGGLLSNTLLKPFSYNPLPTVRFANGGSKRTRNTPVLIRDENLAIEGVLPQQLDTMRTTWNYLTSKGVSPRNAAAIMGNMMQESSFNPAIVQKGGDSAIGYFQMHGQRLKDYNSYLKEKNLKNSDLTQLDYMIDVINGNRKDFYIDEYNRVKSVVNSYGDPSKLTGSKLANYNRDKKYFDSIYGKREKSGTLYPISALTEAYNNPETSLNDATDLFTNTIERAGKPEYEKRQSYANSFYRYFYGVPKK